jgi:hypothetical protein
MAWRRGGAGPQVSSALRAWAPAARRVRSLNFQSALCIAVQRGAKFVPQPFVCLADRTRPMWIEFRVSASDHRQRFGNCLGLAIPARRMDHCFAPLPQYLHASTKRASPCERYFGISSKLRRILARHIMKGWCETGATRRGLDVQAARPPSSFFSPRATIIKATWARAGEASAPPRAKPSSRCFCVTNVARIAPDLHQRNGHLGTNCVRAGIPHALQVQDNREVLVLDFQ